MNVTLTATLSPPKPGVTFVWDFDDDGVLDTAPSADPTVTHLYPDEVAVTATLGVMKGNRVKGHRFGELPDDSLSSTSLS